MNEDERILEDCKISWREEARARAAREAKEKRLDGKEAEVFIAERAEQIYAELERLGLENL